MKLKIAAVVLLGLIPGVALAQSSPSPNNQAGPGVSPSVQSPTDQGAGAVNGNVTGQPQRAPVGTTGSRLESVTPAPGSAAEDQRMRNASPASPAEGVSKEK